MDRSHLIRQGIKHSSSIPFSLVPFFSYPHPFLCICLTWWSPLYLFSMFISHNLTLFSKAGSKIGSFWKRILEFYFCLGNLDREKREGKGVAGLEEKCEKWRKRTRKKKAHLRTCGMESDYIVCEFCAKRKVKTDQKCEKSVFAFLTSPSQSAK